ncbi:MAG: gamma-glutamylcyclotransferase [Balneolales bacterium]|nr:gamma-glutamylcyclotransferase [Balneolales bacterium]
MLHQVFVYGTLKKNHANHYLLSGARFVGLSELRGFELWDLGSFPGIIPADKPGLLVQAELYETDHETLQRLDELEDYFGPGDERNLYDRTLTTDTSGRKGWVYVLRKQVLVSLMSIKKARLIPEGNF